MKKYISTILMCLGALSCSDKLAELEIVEFGATLQSGCSMPLDYKAGAFGIVTGSGLRARPDHTQAQVLTSRSQYITTLTAQSFVPARSS